MMTEQERAIVERELAEAERTGYQQALMDLQTYLRERIDSIDLEHWDMPDQFKYGVCRGFDKVFAWSYKKVDF